MVVYEIPLTKRRKSFFSSFSVNTWLIILNVFFYFLFSILLALKFIPIEYLALNPRIIFENFYIWTFLTSMFMHAGFFHLFVNVLSLFFVGSLLEKILGPKRFLFFYLFAGLFAGLLFVLSPALFPGDWNSFAVGASGALFGLIGVLIFLTPNLPVYMMFIPIPIKIKYAAPGMLVLLWLVSILGNVPIGNVAHLGGLLAGIFYGLFLRKKFPNKVKLISRRFS